MALSANLAWISLILARLAMKGGQVQEPKLMTRRRLYKEDPVKCVTQRNAGGGHTEETPDVSGLGLVEGRVWS